jgi:hypothetical protein
MIPVFAFLLVLAFIGGMIYLLVVQREVPGIVEQRFGVLEALPSDVGKWKADDDSEAGKAAAARGLLREERLFHNPNAGGFFGGGKLVRQVRYRNRATNEIVKVEPDEPVRRKRVRA